MTEDTSIYVSRDENISTDFLNLLVRIKTLSNKRFIWDVIYPQEDGQKAIELVNLLMEYFHFRSHYLRTLVREMEDYIKQVEIRTENFDSWNHNNE